MTQVCIDLVQVELDISGLSCADLFSEVGKQVGQLQ